MPSHYTKPFELFTDASDTGISAVLVQEKGIVGICSAKLLHAEKNYSICEREMLAVYKCLLHFKNIVYNTDLYVCTDNRNNTFNIKNLNSRMSRWVWLFEEMNVKFKHIKGERIQQLMR